MPDASEIERRLLDMAAGSGVYVSCGKERIRHAFYQRSPCDLWRKHDALIRFFHAVDHVFGREVLSDKQGKSTWYHPPNTTFRSAARKLARLIADRGD